MTAVGAVREVEAGERRAALVPAAVGALVRDGLEVLVEAGLGAHCGYADADYAEAGARIAADAGEVHRDAQVIVAVAPPGDAAIGRLGPGHALVSFLDPLGDPARIRRIADTGATALAFELVPRTTRAQSMDALSSQATIAGYHGVLLAAERSPRLFPLLMTAAGTVKARSVLVLGAGVAGLQAIATARRLGAVVTAFDVRAAAREQVESLGARFLAVDIAGDEQAGGYATELDAEQHHREQAALAAACADADVVICTAQIPGAPAPELVTEAAVRAMRAGSVIVDLAASTGGNCACTVPGGEAAVDGVLVLGPLHPASAMPASASDLYAANVRALVGLLAPAGALAPDWEDEILQGSVVARDGAVTSARVAERLAGAGAS